MNRKWLVESKNVKQAAMALIDSSAYFAMTPLPDNMFEFEFEFKDEETMNKKMLPFMAGKMRKYELDIWRLVRAEVEINARSLRDAMTLLTDGNGIEKKRIDVGIAHAYGNRVQLVTNHTICQPHCIESDLLDYGNTGEDRTIEGLARVISVIEIE